MRTLVVLLALSTALLAAACAYLVWRASDERALAASDDGSRALQFQIDSLVAERAQLRSEIELARSAAPCAPTPSISATSMRADNAAGSAAGPFASARSGPRAGLFDHLTPEQRRTMVRERYGALLYKEMSLSDTQVEALLPVLVEQDQVKGTPRESFGPRDTPQAREREREIAAVIGAEKAAQFAELRSSIPARVQVRMMREDLERAGAPLSDAQNAALMAALKDFGLPKPPPPISDETPQQSIERFRASHAERTKQIRELTAPLLTPRQLQRLDELESMRGASGAMPFLSK